MRRYIMFSGLMVEQGPHICGFVTFWYLTPLTRPTSLECLLHCLLVQSIIFSPNCSKELGRRRLCGFFFFFPFSKVHV